MSAMIPEGWIKASLSEVVAVNPKHTDLEDQVAGFVPMALAPTDFNGTLNYEERQWNDIKKGYTHFATGDIIFAKVTPCFENGKAAIVKDMPNGIGAGSTEFYVLRPLLDSISSDYIFSVIKSYEFLQTGAENMTGAVGLRRVPKKFVEDFKINLPPLAEQKVIADKLDELLAQVESTKARLDAIPAILKSFRQSVLAAAVSGKLTKEWRGDNESSLISQLLEKVDQRRLDKRSEKFAFKPFRPDEVTLEIPKVWEWVRLARIAEIVSGVAKGSKSKDELIELPYLRVANVQRGYLNLDEIKQISVSANNAENLYLKKGDILFNEGGDIDKLGRGWIWEEQVKNCIHQNHVFRARSYSPSIQSKYISHYGNSEGKEYFLREGTQSVNLANINKTTLSLLPIPLPPVEEQTEIVRRVEELFAFADKVEAQVNAAQSRVNNLTQSILAKAFRGELTADWRAANPELITGENSASALLKYIKAERETLAVKKKPTNKLK